MKPLPRLQNLIEEMATVTFDIEDHHGRPHWSHHGHFQLAYLVFVNDASDVAPQIVVAQAHVGNVGTVAVESVVAMLAKRNTTVATQSIACLSASLASSNVFGTTDNAIFPVRQFLLVAESIYMQGALPFVIVIAQFRTVLPRGG